MSGKSRRIFIIQSPQMVPILLFSCAKNVLIIFAQLSFLRIFKLKIFQDKNNDRDDSNKCLFLF